MGIIFFFLNTGNVLIYQAGSFVVVGIIVLLKISGYMIIYTLLKIKDGV